VSALAYVFWHSPVTASPTYQGDLLAFHASLAADPPAGFVRSETFGLTGASWLDVAAAPYEDWYLVTDWQAIGELNQAAVATAHVAAHDRVAHQAGSGAGAIYGLHAGTERPGDRVGTWFAKPPGWSYARLDEALTPVLDGAATLWRRQMVLGPAPEFCLRSDAPQNLPDGIDGELISYRSPP
jgi:hypothetical protein